MLKINTVIIGTVFLGVIQSTAVQSVEPMSESDMGNISAESGNVLNIMGSPASGNSPGDKQIDSANEQALSSVNYIEVDQSLEPRNNSSLTPSNINPEDSISTFKVSERTNGQNGIATLYYDEKANQTTSSYSDKALTINQNAQVERVQIEQVRHSAGAPIRGDYTFGDIQVNSAVTIIER